MTNEEIEKRLAEWMPGRSGYCGGFFLARDGYQDPRPMPFTSSLDSMKLVEAEISSRNLDWHYADELLSDHEYDLIDDGGAIRMTMPLIAKIAMSTALQRATAAIAVIDRIT